MHRVRVPRLLAAVVGLLVCIAALNAWFVYGDAALIEYDAAFINDMGRVRGSIQRACKLAMAGAPSEEVVRRVDVILEAMRARVESFGSAPEEQEFFDGLDELTRSWERIRERLLADGGEIDRVALLADSETCWRLADDAVVAAQRLSEARVRHLHYALVIIGVNALGVIAVVWLVQRFVHVRLEHLAHHDSLTDLHNRHAYEETLQLEMDRAERYGSPLSLIILDIDHFKRVNDEHGHRAGDDVLRRMADILRRSVRSSDTVFRIGGEEFAVLAPSTGLDGARSMAEKLRAAVADEEFPKVGRITASFGVAAFGSGDDEDSLFGRADKALYAAKDGGRNRVETG